MCVIDWGFVAAWIAATSTFGLLIAAYVGFGQWKNQFVKERDHDLALKVLQVVSTVHIRVREVRHPTPLISDFDLPNPTDEYENDPEMRSYGMALRMYRARQHHLAAALEIRVSVMNEALVVWGEFGKQLAALILELSSKEIAVQQAVWLHVDGLNPRSGDTERPDFNILYAPADPVTPDQFATEYEAIVDRVRKYLGPNIRMD